MTTASPGFNTNGRLRFFSILLLLVAYLPLRNVFSRAFVGIPFMQAFANLFIEITLVLLLILLLLQRWRAGRELMHTPLDFLFALLTLSIFLSIAINIRFNMESVRNALILIRYISVYYIVVNLPLSQKDIRQFMILMVALGLGTAVVTVILYFVPTLNQAVENFFLPVNVLFLPPKIGAVRGIFPAEVELASFLLVALIVYMGYIRRAKGMINFLIAELVIPALFLLAIFATYKRAILLLAFFVLWRHWMHRNFSSRHQAFARFITVVGFLLVFIVLLSLDVPSMYGDLFIQAGNIGNVRKVEFDPVLFIAQLFTPVYWQHVATWQRGWVILNIAPYILTSQYWLFGLSPDSTYMQIAIIQKNANLGYLANLVQSRAFEDTYWVALLAYYGLAGLSLFFFILYKLFWIAQKSVLLTSDRLSLASASIFQTYLIVFVYSGFVYRVPEFRPSSFLFWLLAGLTTRLYLEIRSTQTK